jgi:hypothetical protein
MNTEINYNETLSQLTINKSLGSYQGAPSQRQYQINFFGLQSDDITTKFGCVWLNGKASKLEFDKVARNVKGTNIESVGIKPINREKITLRTVRLPMDQDIVIKACQ